MQLLAHGAGVLEGVPAGRGLDAARASRDTAFGQDDETARLTGAVQMRAAAKLHGLGVIRVADGHHAHGVAVLFTEERHGAHVDGGLLAHELGGQRVVGHDRGVHVALHGGQLLRGHGRDVREVEAQAIRRDQRTRLTHMIAEHAAQGRMEQVRAGVVAGRVEAYGFGHGQHHFLIGKQGAAVHLDVVDGEVGGGLQGVEHLGRASRSGEQPRVAALAAGRAVERRLIGNDVAQRAAGQGFDGQAVVVEQGHDAAHPGQGGVAEKFGLEAVFEQALET